MDDYEKRDVGGQFNVNIEGFYVKEYYRMRNQPVFTKVITAPDVKLVYFGCSIRTPDWYNNVDGVT